MRCRFAELLSGSKNTSKIHPSYRQLLSNLDSCAFAKDGTRLAPNTYSKSSKVQASAEGRGWKSGRYEPRSGERIFRRYRGL